MTERRLRILHDVVPKDPCLLDLPVSSGDGPGTAGRPPGGGRIEYGSEKPPEQKIKQLLQKIEP
jgi:hypothetical protein